jgi:AraC-like DNA-binding protein
MSRSHFSHHFRAHTGLTPGRFIAEFRVGEAAKMLRDPRLPLKQIAAANGFADANHFCKVFRRFQHMSPTSYRRAIAGMSA